MNRTILFACGLLALGIGRLDAQALGFDPYFSHPGYAQDLGLALLPASTPDITKIGEMSTTDVMAKYSIDSHFEVGARASFGFLHDQADALSSLTLGGRYLWQEDLSVAIHLTPQNEAGALGLSLGALGSFHFTELDLDTKFELGLLDGYTPVGASLHLLVRPSRHLHRGITGFIDLDVMSNTDDLGEHLSVLMGPNVEIELDEGWRINTGAFFSVMSGAFAADTELGFRLAIQRYLSLR